MKKPRGWLTNTKRRSRRDNPSTFTDSDAEKLIQKIDRISNYISEIFGVKLDYIMRTRDKALIALNWIFFKRGGEVLKLKRKDVEVTKRELIVTFSIQKKKKRCKICPDCDEKNGFRSRFCRKCSRNLEDVEIFEEGSTAIVTKRKTLAHKIVKYVVNWIERFDKITRNQKNRAELLLFPPLRVAFSSAYFDFLPAKPMTIQNFDRILQRLDPTMTSCLFRYGGSEKYLALGYTPSEMQQIGDWESSFMPELYAKRKGITPIQRRWSEDVR